MNEILAAIRKFADEAHGEQKRKYTPERYIVHPVRVMELVENTQLNCLSWVQPCCMMYWKTRRLDKKNFTSFCKAL